jgi:hypothetical protein
VTGRSAHLVGSLPGDSAEHAMTDALARLGPRLRSLPDGETGDRRNWIIHIIESLRTHPDLELVKDGDWSDYDRLPRFRVRSGHRLYGASLDFGHVDAVLENLPVFQALRGSSGAEELSFQVGIPGDLDMAMFSLGPTGALRHRRAFSEATLNEITRIHALTDGAAVFQLEVPAELVFVAGAPSRGQSAVAWVLARQIAALVRGAPTGTRFGVHLCLGDMNHRALGRMTDAAPLVALTNALARSWPHDRPLEFVHAPFAAAEEPPPTDTAFYAPLSDLSLPRGIRFVAGIAHEDQPLADQLRIRGVVDDQVGSTVDISTSCGLGRREPDAAHAALDRINELCND